MKGFLLVLVLLRVELAMGSIGGNGSGGPKSVNIGALFTFNSVIGRAVKPAIQAAVDDVNSDSRLLSGINFNLTFHDTSCSGFLGTMEALQLMMKDVAIAIGPQSSGIAHLIANVVNERHVPLLTLATDPTLSSLQYPYLLRTVQSDYHQMNAIADLIDYFGWKEVIAIFADNAYGRNGISELGVSLAHKGSKISYKAAFLSSADIKSMLLHVNRMKCRVYVVHVNPDSGLSIFSVAKSLGMVESGYVWIATDWLPSFLDGHGSSTWPDNITHVLQGVLAFRHYTPDSNVKRKFVSRWKSLKFAGNSSLNSYSYYAYDSVWTAARALDKFFNQGGNIAFVDDPRLNNVDTLNLRAMHIFKGGERLLKILVSTNYTGLSGPIQFDSDQNLVLPAFDILNIVGNGYRNIGYWSYYSGLSVLAPEHLKPSTNTTVGSQQLLSVTWPGKTHIKPRGWVLVSNGQPLKIAVPYRVTYKEFVSKGNTTIGVQGFCIDVFEASLKLLPYPVPHTYVLFGDGTSNPNYYDLTRAVAQNEYDAAVGDIAISTERKKSADFTQPFMESGLVIIAHVKEFGSNQWVFLQPLTPLMWLVTATLIPVVGAIVWILEHRINEKFRGSPTQQIDTIFWFSFSTIFFKHRETPASPLGRFVLIVWLFVVLIIISSYKASLTSVLTTQQLSTHINGLDSLITSNEPIGISDPTFAFQTLVHDLNIAKSRIINLGGRESYLWALQRGPKNGGVAAIVDELPYAQVFLSTTKHAYKIVGQQFTKNEWGFASVTSSPLRTLLEIFSRKRHEM